MRPGDQVSLRECTERVLIARDRHVAKDSRREGVGGKGALLSLPHTLPERVATMPSEGKPKPATRSRGHSSFEGKHTLEAGTSLNLATKDCVRGRLTGFHGLPMHFSTLYLHSLAHERNIMTCTS